MKTKLLLLPVLLLQLATCAQRQKPPTLGIVAPLEQDSLIYASGFRMLGESVGRMLSPSLTEEQFQANLQRIKAAKCKVYICNIFISGRLKIAGPAVEEASVLGYADTVFDRAQPYQTVAGSVCGKGIVNNAKTIDPVQHSEP